MIQYILNYALGMTMMFSYEIDSDVRLALPRPKLDAPPLFNLIETSRKELAPWLPWVPSIKRVEDEQTFLETAMEHFGTGYSLNTVIFFQNHPAGMISFNRFRAMDQSSEIGYWLGTKFVGHGIMHRAVSGMCALGFNDYQVHKLEIHAAVENQRSNHVAQQAGFHFDGCIRAFELLPDGFHDGNIWTMLSNEWTANGHI